MIRDSTEIKRFQVGVNPLLLNSIDSKLDIILEILSHHPKNHRKSHPKHVIRFQVLVLQNDGTKVHETRTYSQLKDRLLFTQYCNTHNLQHLIQVEGKRKPPQLKDTFMA